MPGLRLIVGFEVRDEDFFTRIRGTEGCPNGHGGGVGPFCNECGTRFERTESSVQATVLAAKVASWKWASMRIPNGTVTDWRVWVQDAHRNQGAVVVGRSGDTWALGFLVGQYESGKPMTWPASKIVEMMMACDELKDRIGAVEAYPPEPHVFAERETRLYLIE